MVINGCTPLNSNLLPYRMDLSAFDHIYMEKARYKFLIIIIIDRKPLRPRR